MQNLTDDENVMLRSIAGQSRRGDGWAEVPVNDAWVANALRHLSAHGMIVRRHGAFWYVRATQKAFAHIEARKRGKPHRAKSHNG